MLKIRLSIVREHDDKKEGLMPLQAEGKIPAYCKVFNVLRMADNQYTILEGFPISVARTK